MQEVVMYNKIAGWPVDGENVKRDGERRKWRATLTGKSRLGVRGDKQVEVKENGMTKWISLSSFTDKLGDVKLIEGQRPDDQKTFEW
jgi:hypothetical protein